MGIEEITESEALKIAKRVKEWKEVPTKRWESGGYDSSDEYRTDYHYSHGYRGRIGSFSIKILKRERGFELGLTFKGEEVELDDDCVKDKIGMLYDQLVKRYGVDEERRAKAIEDREKREERREETKRKLISQVVKNFLRKRESHKYAKHV